MTTELEKKLKISRNTCIYCPTIELAKQVLDIFHKIGLKWCSGTYYILCTNWDSHKENTVYYPFYGIYSSLEYAQRECYKIISAEEFIALHIEDEEFDLKNYEPKGELEGFPKEIISHMLECQVEQGNKRDVSVFERNIYAALDQGGFDWDTTIEKGIFWSEVISANNLKLFFERYPKKDNQQDNSQEFKVGDKVYDISLGKIGIVKRILNDVSAFPIEVYYEDYGRVLYAHEGKFSSKDKYPRLLHYRDDYDYSVINFNNLPKRQEVKRWRAEVGETYYSFTSNFKIEDYCEDNHFIDDEAYNSRNYFKTKEEAQEVTFKLKKYFNQLIKEEQDHEKN